MAKNPTPQQLPAPGPGAIPPASDPESEVQASVPATEADSLDPVMEICSSAQVAEVRAKFRVNWHFTGFREKDLQPGDEVETTEEEAAPYLGHVLTRLESEA